MEQEQTTQVEEQPAEEAHFFWVAIYEVNRCYGGPQEGGWWYDRGELVITPDVYGEMMPKAFADKDEAYSYRDQLRERAEQVNREEGRRELSSVLCTGRYTAEVHSDGLPAFYPEERPHYE